MRYLLSLIAALFILSPAQAGSLVQLAPNVAKAAVTWGNPTIKAVATAGTPVQLVTASTLVETVEIHARKDKTTANTGNIYVGFVSGAGNQLRVLVPGESWKWTAAAGKKIQLNSIWIDAATNADAVVFTTQN